MITQQELLDRLNQLTLRYNLTWFDIKWDADKAINKINSYMGTKYPKISSIMLAPTSTYTLGRDGDSNVYEIFPEEYFHSVVIPYIAMEILARDEEFTTIYNKYNAELDDGLFHMFEKEFNRVPLIFRQDIDAGVFFATETIQGKIQRTKEENLPEFKFRVFYHINNSDVVLSTDTALRFVEDNTMYAYKDTAEVKGWYTMLFSLDHARAYTFLGWTLGKGQVTPTLLQGGDDLLIESDVHLYAVWEGGSIFSINKLNGAITLKDTFKYSFMPTLVIPDFIDGTPVAIIPTDFIYGQEGPNAGRTNHAPWIHKIILPKHLTTISESAFRGFIGDTIIFPEEASGLLADGITINNLAFEKTPNLESILIPNSVKTINGSAFPRTQGKTIDIYCRVLESNKPDTWSPTWYEASDPVMYYVAKVWWGHNG